MKISNITIKDRIKRRETNVALRIGLSPSVGDRHLLLLAKEEPAGERDFFFLLLTHEKNK